MPTTIGTNTVTSIARRYILPTVVDTVYGDNVVFFRLNRARKRLVSGGTQIDVPWMYARMAAGGPYRGYEVLNMVPSDTVKNGSWDWKQQYVPVVVDGLTMIQVDSPDAVVNYLDLQFQQATMEMSDNLGTGVWSDGSNAKQIDGLEAAVDDGGVAATYGNLSRASNTFLNATDDSTSAALTLGVMQSAFMSASSGGRHPTLIASRVEQYNRFWALNASNQEFPVQPAGHDEQLASAGFTNVLFNNVPWVVDEKVPDGPNASNSGIYLLNEDYLTYIVSTRADFYLEDFQTPTDQDAMSAKLLWAGNLLCLNPARQAKLTNVSA